MILFLLATFLFGLIVGSFLNVLILRLPKNLSIGGRSHCQNCNLDLTWRDLFPVFSYLFLRGKCRQCKQKISSRYVLIELITGILFALTWFIVQPQDLTTWILLFRNWLIVSVLITVFVIDLEHYLILDKIVFPATLVVVFLNIALDYFNSSSFVDINSFTLGGVLSALLGASIFFSLWFFSKGKWMGFGDVKFMLFLGMALGFPDFFVSLFLAFVLGGIVGIMLIVSGKKAMQSQLPFGTFLSLASLLALFYGKNMLAWYLSFLGL